MSLIFVETIALVVYLGSWALEFFVIICRLMLDLHSFLLEVIGANNLGSFPFQALLRLFQELFPLVVATCLPLFEQLVERGTY